MTDVTIVSNELPPGIPQQYVVVGTGKDAIVMANDSYKYWILFGIAFVIVVIFLLLLYMFFVPGDALKPIIKRKPDPIPLAPIESVDTLFGATLDGKYYSPEDGFGFLDATSCNANSTSYWDSSRGVCVCRSPWWGTTCNRTTYSNQFIGVGQYDPIPISSITPPATDTSSNFSSLIECTDACSMNPGCSGVIWEVPTMPFTCTEFSTISITPGRTIPYHIGVDSNIYVKNQNITNLIHTDRVFLYSGTLPIRHWERTLFTSAQGNQQTVSEGIVYLLSFYPTAAINGGQLTGVYSTSVFSPADYDALLAGGDTTTVYIHRPNTPLTLPILWIGRNIWVMYKSV
jgi:hypothetical protein